MDDKSKAASSAPTPSTTASNAKKEEEKSEVVNEKKNEVASDSTASASTASSSDKDASSAKDDVQSSSASSKEAVSAAEGSKESSSSAAGTASSDNKRPREASEEDASDEAVKKKSKKEESASTSAPMPGSNASSTASSLNPTAASSKPSRGTRGSLSSEKNDKASKGAKRRGSPSSSATNSPKKPASRDHSDEEEDGNKQKSGSGSNSGSNEPKVPPLKIVLTGQNGNSGTSSVVEDKKSPSGNKDDSKEVDKPASSRDATTASASAEIADNSNTNPSAVSEGIDDADSKGASGNGSGHSSGHGTRLTRSRANQGTPGPNDPGNDSPRESALNQCENANLEPPTSKEVMTASSSSNVQSQSNSQSSSSNMNYADYHVKKRKLRSQVEDSNANGSMTPSASTSAGPAATGETKSKASSNAAATATNEPLNDIEKYLNIRKQVEQRRKNLFPVQPKPPQGFKDYLMNRKTYLLQGNAHERLRSIPMIQPPHSLDGPLRELFKQQEEERYKLRLKHVVEKEKLVLAVEQEILRVHGRAARALANQSLPYSVCTILRDEEIYTPIDPQQEEKNRDIRSRYNGRLFLSWLQDVDDKWEKIKEQMVLRHHNEAESLNAVQKMDWEWKVSEITGGPAASGGENVPLMDDLHIPMVHVSDDFDMSIS